MTNTAQMLTILTLGVIFEQKSQIFFNFLNKKHGGKYLTCGKKCQEWLNTKFYKKNFETKILQKIFLPR